MSLHDTDILNSTQDVVSPLSVSVSRLFVSYFSQSHPLSSCVFEFPCVSVPWFQYIYIYIRVVTYPSVPVSTSVRVVLLMVEVLNSNSVLWLFADTSGRCAAVLLSL